MLALGVNVASQSFEHYHLRHIQQDHHKDVDQVVRRAEGRFTEVSGHSSAIDVSRVVGVVQLTTTQYPFMEGFTNVPLLLLGSIS